MSLAIRKAIRSVAANTMLVRERWESGVAYNPLSSSTAQDPYPVYAALRERDPVHRSRLMNAWVFTRHADVETILRDHRRFSNNPRKGNLTRRQRVQLPPDDDLSMLFLDPPDHKRLRGLVNKAFTPRAVNALEPHIRSLLGALLDDIDDPAGFDLMVAVAQPLPVIVIAEMLGVPPKDRAQFKIWSDQRARLLEPTIDSHDREVAEATSRTFDDYFRPIIKECRVAPQDNIVSALVQAEDDGNQLTERETLNMLRLLLIAGNETTTNMIGNSMLALLRHPDQLQQLRENPSLVPAAVEELLRFDSPVQMSMRRPLEDCEVNGFPVRERENIVVLLGAANRDPDVFENPDWLDFERREGNHLAFGRGIHHCLGAPLARLEGRIVLETLLERFPQISLLTERPRFRNSIVLRGLESLPLYCVRA